MYILSVGMEKYFHVIFIVFTVTFCKSIVLGKNVNIYDVNHASISCKYNTNCTSIGSEIPSVLYIHIHT